VSAPSHAARQGESHPTVDPDQLEIAPGTARQSVEGWVPALATEEGTRAALEQAFDYRGDVTITRKDGTKIEGYLFDRVTAPDLASSFVRLLPKDSNQRVRISYADIAALAFSGRDPAAGKSWDAWVSKYWAKKTAGEGDISIQPEALD
jgi:hypothetical protein